MDASLHVLASRGSACVIVHNVHECRDNGVGDEGMELAYDANIFLVSDCICLELVLIDMGWLYVGICHYL